MDRWHDTRDTRGQVQHCAEQRGMKLVPSLPQVPLLSAVLGRDDVQVDREQPVGEVTADRAEVDPGEQHAPAEREPDQPAVV